MSLDNKIIKRIIKIILVILIFVGISLTNGNSRKITIFEEIFNSIIMLPQKGIQMVQYMLHEENINSDEEILIQENKKIKEENASLKEKLTEFELLQQENKQLKIENEAKSQYKNKNVVIADIISRSINNWDEIYVIDKGLKSGINPNDVVITLDGLVGYVLTCDDDTSKVVSILDVTSTLSARARETREDVVIKGDILYKGQNKVKATSIPIDVLYKSGDVFETSGMGGIYPKGISIGCVEEFIQKPNPIENEAIIRLAVDFKRIETVGVIID